MTDTKLKVLTTEIMPIEGNNYPEKQKKKIPSKKQYASTKVFPM